MIVRLELSLDHCELVGRNYRQAASGVVHYSFPAARARYQNPQTRPITISTDSIRATMPARSHWEYRPLPEEANALLSQSTAGSRMTSAERHREVHYQTKATARPLSAVFLLDYHLAMFNWTSAQGALGSLGGTTSRECRLGSNAGSSARRKTSEP